MKQLARGHAASATAIACISSAALVLAVAGAVAGPAVASTPASSAPAVAASPAAQGPIAWQVCSGAPNFACGQLKVPLDPSGTYPGTITLSIRRRRAPVGSSSVAIVALAGGPGQAAIPFATELEQLVAPGLATHDLIVFDQRGTGTSGALRCRALQEVKFVSLSPASQIAQCASELGRARDFYSTSDSVADIEAIREAAGYDKLILYGTSYGTWVAMAYARAYPQYTAGLILDSTLPPGGPDVYSNATFKAIPHALADLCSDGACAHITSTPYRDLARLVARLRVAPLTAVVYDGRGHPFDEQINEDDVIETLVNGDLDPSLRADFPAAVVSALRGDDAPLGALIARATGGGSSVDASVDNALYYATSCEDDPFPWQRTASRDERLTEATQALDRLPHDAFAPFDLETALSLSNAPQCISWPSAGEPLVEGAAAQAAQSQPLPDVPTLIFSGAEDLRTPTENARAVAAQIPDAALVVVAHSGHSVLSTSGGDCAEQAVRAFFEHATVHSCPKAPREPLGAPTAIAPVSLSAVRPAHGLTGLVGRTDAAVSMTVAQAGVDLLRALEDGGGGAAGAAASFGGLRGGWAALSIRNGLELHDFSYVPGVTLTGGVAPGSLLTIGGSAAAHGTLSVTARDGLVGTLDGQTVHGR